MCWPEKLNSNTCIVNLLEDKTCWEKPFWFKKRTFWDFFGDTAMSFYSVYIFYGNLAWMTKWTIKQLRLYLHKFCFLHFKWGWILYIISLDKNYYCKAFFLTVNIVNFYKYCKWSARWVNSRLRLVVLKRHMLLLWTVVKLGTTSAARARAATCELGHLGSADLMLYVILWMSLTILVLPY